MTKLIVSLVLVLGLQLAIVRAQFGPTTLLLGPAGASGADVVPNFADIGSIIVQSRIQKANLPDDLLTKALDLAVNTRTAYDGCKTNAGPMPWQYRLCVIGNMRMTNFALAQLETEARDREVAAALAASEAAANAAGAV